MGFMDGFTSDGTVDMKHTEYYNLMKEPWEIWPFQKSVRK